VSAAGGALVLASVEPGVVSDAVKAVVGVYGQSDRTVFSPEVTVTVPSTGGGANLYAGVDIVVSFAAVGGSDSGCVVVGSETWRINDGGTTTLSGGSAVLVDRPQGVASRCSYNAIFPASAAGGALVRTLAGPAVVSAAARSAAATYINAEIRGEEISSAKRGLGQLPVEVSIRVSGDADRMFAPWEAFEVLVHSPGACGSDVLLFGGVPLKDGVTYSVRASVGRSVVIGAGATMISPAASYTLPAFIFDDEGEIVPCAVRVAEIKAPHGCVASDTDRDEMDRSFVEVGWKQGAAVFDVSLDYDCADPTSSLTLSEGWNPMTFRSPDGLSPLNFSASLDYAVSKVCRWDIATQRWQCWSAFTGDYGLRSLQQGEAMLGSMQQGEAVMVYVPKARTVRYSPANLLGPADDAETLVLPHSGYYLHVFNSEAPVSVAGLAGGSQVVVYRWDVPSQQFQRADIVQPGDGVMLGNPEVAPVTIALR